MNKIKLPAFTLIGLALPGQTTNQNNQSAIDCGSHWQRFEKGNYADRIKDKLSDEVFAVYHLYEGDHTQPYSYFIGCKVDPQAGVPEGMDRLIIPADNYQKIIAKGIMPDCVANAWKEIWTGTISRAYHADFEVYGEKSKDWNNAEVEIYLSVTE
ncbi:MAG: GyrI-like domain-containing protein [Bacteroidota bacterium]